MFYLEDLAYEVKTPKVIKARNILATVIFAFGLIQILLIFTGRSSQANIIQNNKIAIADYQQKCNEIDTETEQFKNKNNMIFYNSWEQGNAVAELQAEYGGFRSDATIESVTEKAKKTAEKLDTYIKEPIARTPWYANMYQNYFWIYMNRQTSLIENIPSIWICRSNDNNTILGVATAEYDALGEVFEDFKFYYTTKGNALLEEDVQLVNGNVISSEDYMNYYKNVNKIVEEMANTENDEKTDDSENADESDDTKNADDIQDDDSENVDDVKSDENSDTENEEVNSKEDESNNN